MSPSNPSQPTSLPAPPVRNANYLRVIATFCRNSLIRDMSFRADFILQCISSMSWAVMNFMLFKIIYRFTDSIGRDTGWGEHEFFVFLGTIWIINSLIQTFFMQNFDEFSDLIRTGNLDFALLKPIDTQLLISFPRTNWSQLANGALGVALVIYSVAQLLRDPEKHLQLSIFTMLGFLLFIVCGVAVMYSVMLALASTSIWLGRNQNLYDFWFYITNFYRYPMEIYQRSGMGWALWGTFTFVIPVLVVSNIPARVLAQPLGTPWKWWEWSLAGYAIVAAVLSLLASRWVFLRALRSYRSASS
jgi:ABC-2 type transport system permease protein